MVWSLYLYYKATAPLCVNGVKKRIFTKRLAALLSVLKIKEYILYRLFFRAVDIFADLCDDNHHEGQIEMG